MAEAGLCLVGSIVTVAIAFQDLLLFALGFRC